MILLTAAFIGLALTGCNDSDGGGKTTTPAGGVQAAAGNTGQNSGDDKYTFTYEGIDIVLGAEAGPIVKALGEPKHVFEDPSCAFEGIDKMYYYDGFIVNTYPDGDKDYVLSVVFSDDSVKTDKGIYLGMTLEDITKAYGDGYENDLGLYTYTLGLTELSFIIEDGKIADIKYYYNVL